MEVDESFGHSLPPPTLINFDNVEKNDFAKRISDISFTPADVENSFLQSATPPERSDTFEESKQMPELDVSAVVGPGQNPFVSFIGTEEPGEAQLMEAISDEERRNQSQANLVSHVFRRLSQISPAMEININEDSVDSGTNL